MWSIIGEKEEEKQDEKLEEKEEKEKQEDRRRRRRRSRRRWRKRRMRWNEETTASRRSWSLTAETCQTSATPSRRG